MPAAEPHEVQFVSPIDEIEPHDYLTAEVKRIEEATRFLHDESPSIAIHAVIAVVDLLVVALSSAPFVALINITNGDLAQTRTQLAAAIMVLVVSFFYLALTQALSGKTFGMMLTNTRVVDSRSFEQPSAQWLLLRTIGYFLALAPAGLGILWIMLDRRRRGWHDLLSGTRVVRDF
jgi:uncharacterized RDD family membrane protein YckC